MTVPDPSSSPEQHAGTTSARRVGTVIGQSAASAVIGGRDAIRRHPVANTAYRAGVGVVGGATVALGVALMPLPGPGTLISIGGLGILATEFEGAKKVQVKAIDAAKKTVGVAKRVRDRRRPARQPEPNDAAAG